jgi:MerR family transcriptional regulator, mercuric resistance operon regulatory protein
MKDADPPVMKIGEIAHRFGLNVRTLRYYEELGLLPAPARSDTGYRLYLEVHVERLRFVLQAKHVGFSLEEIQLFVQLGERERACSYVQQTLMQHVSQVEAQIADLRRRRDELTTTVSTWRRRGTVPGRVCGLIEQSALPSQATNKEIPMTTQKRTVEVFTAGCPVCEPAVELVQQVACPNCEVMVYNVKDDAGAAARARDLGIHRLPMVFVDGRPLECCQIGPVTEAALRAAGVGAP